MLTRDKLKAAAEAMQNSSMLTGSHGNSGYIENGIESCLCQSEFGLSTVKMPAVSTGVKELYLSTSLDDLNKKALIKPQKRSTQSHVTSACKIFKAAEECRLDGDEEQAYLLYINFLIVYDIIKKRPDFTHMSKYYMALLGGSSFSEALEEAERLSDTLKLRYEEVEVRKKLEEKEIQEEKKRKEEIKVKDASRGSPRGNEKVNKKIREEHYDLKNVFSKGWFKLRTMTSKGAKETIASKLGFKSSSSASKAEVELDKVRKENAHLRRKMEDLAKRHIKSPDSDKSKLLERIVYLDTLREKNNQQLLVKEQEVETLRQLLTARGEEVVASLQTQLEQRRKEGEQRDAMFQNLTQETEDLKNRLASVSAHCQSLETQVKNEKPAPPADMSLVQDQLRDALEKNQQWLAYDQQREAYVSSIHAHVQVLEQQLAQAKAEVDSGGEKPAADSAGPEKETQLRSHYEQLLSAAQNELQNHKEQVARLQQELSVQIEQTLKAQAQLQSQKDQVRRLQDEMLALQRKYEGKSGELSSLLSKYGEKSKELSDVGKQLQAERLANRHAVCEERKVSSNLTDGMREELETLEVRLDEEKKRSAELLLQVNMLQKSLLSQNEEQRRIADLEQQIQLAAKDFESDKTDRQRMQRQLHKVLKELRKARDQIAAKQPITRLSEPSSYNMLEFGRLTVGDPPTLTSSSKDANLMNESFLECPKCFAPYATSRHRELLAHIDYCQL